MDIKIIKYWDVIPRHPKLKWATRKPETIKKIVVHQLASPANPNGPKDIDANIKYFVRPGNHVAANGCPYLPYHVVIDDDGTVYWCNDFNDITWHCKGFNTNSVGVGLMGSFDGPGFKGVNTKPNQIQLDSLIAVLDGFILYQFNEIEKTQVFGHCELDPVNKPACPGTEIMNVLKKWRNG